jgi:hypothetical protein
LALAVLTSHAVAQDDTDQVEGDADEDLALTVENVISDAGEFRLRSGIEYVNVDTEDNQVAFRTIQLSDGRFVSIPAVVGSQREVTDTVVGTASLSYGATGDLEVSADVSGIYTNARRIGPNTGGPESDHDVRFNDVALGLNYRFSRDNATPALFAFGDVTVAARTAVGGSDLAFGRSGTAGLTTFRTIDPVVLTLTGGYRWAITRDAGDRDVDPGDSAFLNPRIAFAVNNSVTLTGGTRFRWQGANEVDGSAQNVDTTRLRLQAGVSYEPRDDLTFRLRSEADAGGGNEAQLGLTVIYTFSI